MGIRKTRTRSRVISESIQQINIGFVKDNLTTTIPAERTTEVFIDEVVDWTDPTWDRSKSLGWQKADLVFNPCDHTYTSVKYENFASIKRTWPENGQPIWFATWVGAIRSVPLTLAIPVDAQSKAFARAAKSIAPSIETYINSINLVNIVLELADVKKLIPNALALIKGIAKRKAIDTAVDGYIGYSFGVAPLLGDIKSIYDILTKLDDAIDKWNSFALAGKTMDFHETIYEIDVDGVKDSYVTSNGGEFTHVNSIASIRSVSKMHLYLVPEFIDDSHRSDAWLKSFQLDKVLTGIWDSVPFSWAIDYFTNVGDIVNSLDYDIENMFKFRVLSAGYSVKTTTIQSGDAQFQNSRGYGSGPKVLYRWETTRYERFKLDQNIFGNQWTKEVPDFAVEFDLNTRQASYLASVGRILTRGG